MCSWLPGVWRSLFCCVSVCAGKCMVASSSCWFKVAFRPPTWILHYSGSSALVVPCESAGHQKVCGSFWNKATPVGWTALPPWKESLLPSLHFKIIEQKFWTSLNPRRAAPPELFQLLWRLTEASKALWGFAWHQAAALSCVLNRVFYNFLCCTRQGNVSNTRTSQTLSD